MNRTTESMVDILRRGGPGALSTNRLREELLRCRPPIVLSPDGLRLIVEESEGRLAQLEVRLDDGETIDSWVVLMDPDDAPPGPGLVCSLWHSLAALAADLDVDSRIEVARWMLKADRAGRTCLAAGGHGLPSARRFTRRR